jgi:hypothetical protein
VYINISNLGTSHGGQLISDVITDGGLRNQEAIVASGSFLIGAIVVILLLYGIGLALTWSHTHK